MAHPTAAEANPPSNLTSALHTRMTDLWRHAGSPPFRALARTAGVPLTSAHAAVRGPALVKLEQFERVLRALAGDAGQNPEPLLEMWHAAHHARLDHLPPRRNERSAYLVLTAEGLLHAFIPDNPGRARRLAAEHAGLVAQIPLIADYTHS